MDSTSQRPPGNFELTGEYLHAMETISAQLMNSLPSGDDLWRVLGQTEALLIEAQIQKTPLSKLFGKGGIAGFCQSIIDEQQGGKKQASPPAISDRPTHKKARETTNRRTRKKKNIITLLVVLAWLLLVAILLCQYTGILPYLMDNHSFYLKELHNFEAEVTLLEDTATSITVPLVAHTPDTRVLYREGGYEVAITYVGFDESHYVEDKPLRRWWIELTYTQVDSFTEITYISPPETGTATVTLADGKEVTQDLHWHDNGYNSDGTAFVRLCFFETDPQTVTEDGTATISFDPMTLVRWQRTGIGLKAS